VQKFMKIFPGQEEMGSLVDTFNLMAEESYDGALTPKLLQSSMAKLGAPLTDFETELVFPILDIDGDKTITVEEFTHFGMAATITAQRIATGIGHSPGSEMYNIARLGIEKLLKLIPQQVLAHFSGRGELSALNKWLQRIDLNNDGEVDFSEFRLAMTKLGGGLTEAEMQMVFPILDADSSGTFDLEELAAFVHACTRTLFLQQKIIGHSTVTNSQADTDKYKAVKRAIDKFLKTCPDLLLGHLILK
jgi:Ca2+-binding EF-hand superfamily protein